MSVKNLKKSKLLVGIVGAGPAGALAAYLMAAAGHKVYLFEKKSTTERKVCGEYLCPKGVELLENLNLFSELCSEFEILHGMLLVSPAHDLIPAKFPSPYERIEKGISLNRYKFDKKILNLAIKQGVIFYPDISVNSVKKISKEKWELCTDKEIHQVDLLIAADGRQSKIAHQLGHAKKVNTKRAALHCYLPRKIAHGYRMGEMHIFNDGSYCGLDPISDNEVNFSIVCDSIKLKKESAKSIINNFIKNSIRLNNMFDPVLEETKVQVVTSLKNDNSFVAGNNLAYVGDAAGFIDPLTGEGIYNALLSSKILTDCVENKSSLELALKDYKVKKNQLNFQKKLLNHFFQIVIKSPFLINLIVAFLKKSQKRADYFIGIIGNIYTPLTGIIKMLKA